MKKVVLIDGNNILFRSYYATAYTGNIMKNSKGFPTNGIYGLINMLNKIINEENPEYVMVAFDKGKTFRHDKYKSYKDGRSETPDELKVQFPIAKKIVNAMGITCYEIDNYEADDIIGTFAKKIDETDCFTATIISSDKDLLQLITDKVDVKLLKQEGFLRMNKETFMDTYGVEPPFMVDLKALMGDSSDNIPGVKGIGEKTAINLLKEHHSLKELYENIELVKGKTKEKLEADRENAFMSYDLATIYKDVPIDTSFENIEYRGIDTLQYIELLEDLEFYSLIKKLNIKKEMIKENVEKEKIEVEIINDISDLKLDGDFSIYEEIYGYDYHKDPIIGFGFYDGKRAYYVPFDVLIKDPSILTSDNLVVTYDMKKMIVSLKFRGLSFSCKNDLMIASYLLNYNLKDDIGYLMRIKDYDISLYEESFGSVAKLKMPSIEEVSLNCAKKAKFLYDIKDEFLKDIEKEEAMYLYRDIEIPLVEVLSDMEITGIKVDDKILKGMGVELKEKLEFLEQSIYEDAGCEFNIMSPKQLGEILFVKLGLPYPKRIKDDSYSTSKDILDKILPYHVIVGKIEEYRTIAKLYNNYITGLLAEISEDGKIHTMFNQTLTRTGRLSSSNPNLQNIPVRLEEGRRIRKAFVPEDDSVILSSDYSQIELRIFASLSNATNLIDAFVHDADIHTKTASEIFHVSLEEVTKDMRRQAKAVNFGILYGISSFGLSEDLNIDMKSAKKFIDEYLNTYPRIKEYMSEVISFAKENGYVKTIMNRKRTIDEINNKNYMIRASGERIALNTPVQGSSADILKKAMVEIYKEFKKRDLKSKMLIQVHDELVFNVLKDELVEVEGIVRDIMENTYSMNVPLKVEITYGNDWYEAK